MECSQEGFSMFVHVQHGVWEYSGTVRDDQLSGLAIKNQGKRYEAGPEELWEAERILLDAYNGRIYRGMIVSRSE